MPTIFFTIALILICITVRNAVREFGTLFNPWFFFLCIEVGVLHVVSIVSGSLLDLYEDERSYAYLLCGSAVYITGYAVAYYVRSMALQSVIFSTFKLIPNISINRSTVIAVILGLVGALALLVVVGQAGTLWFTDPRLAYLSYRGATGDGALFVLAQWMLMLSTAVSIFAVDSKPARVFITLTAYCAVAYFYGSKQVLLNLIIFAVFVLDYQGYKVKLAHLVIIGAMCALIFIAMLGSGGDGGQLANTALYFSEYGVNTAKIFSPEVTKSFFTGEIFISNLWTFLPRFMFSEKPYEYGQVLINSVLFPGAAEQGQTPGLLYWSSWYVDFCFLGVLLFGFLRGTFDCVVYATLRHNRGNVLRVLLAFSLSITPIFLYAPQIYQFIFILIVSTAFRSIAQLVRPRTRDSFRSMSALKNTSES